MSTGMPGASARLWPGLVVADRFRLVRALGEGGMGAVWLAQHVELETPCALKFMHEHAARSPETVARFKREARAAAQLRSPHVVQILDHGVWYEMPYIAMELLEGEDLHKRLRRIRPLGPREVARIATEVGRALTKAHAIGLVHRDLKPANIFLVRDDDREIAKVLDFGVAKVTEGSPLAEARTTTGAVLGTPFYMSPEQLRAEKGVDHRADLWALAVVVYQCLTGHLPFRADVLAELIVKIMVDPIPVPSRAAPEAALPLAFDGWWARATDRDVTRRFQTARDLTESLTLALGLSLGADVGSSPDARSLPGLAPMGSPPTSRIEELDSGLLRTAQPTVTASSITMGETPNPPPRAITAGSLTTSAPPGARGKSPLRILVPVGVVAALGAVALVAFHGGDGSPAPGATAAAAATTTAAAMKTGESPRPPPEAISAPQQDAREAPTVTPVTPSASVEAPAQPVPSASATAAAKATSRTATAPNAAPPAAPAKTSAASAPTVKPRAKHEGVTDF